MLNTVVVHILCCVQFVVVCSLLGAYAWFVVSSLFTRHSLLLYMYTCSFRCKYPLYLGKLSKVNKCYAINQCVWAYNEREYHMLLVAIVKQFVCCIIMFCCF